MSPKPKAERLDQILVLRHFFASRSRARDAVLRGTVKVDGETITKPGQMFDPAVVLEIDDPAQGYVSRAALKLIAALDHFSLDVGSKSCLDVGASTGGFTQVLLERGAEHVTAIDVGHGQMHPQLVGDPRVTNLEGLNARELTSEELGGRSVSVVVSDVSFISLKLALPPALNLAEIGAICVLLEKPQFEAGRDAISKGGLLRQPETAPAIAADLERWLTHEIGWTSLGVIPSPIAGGDGNQEFLLAGRKT